MTKPYLLISDTHYHAFTQFANENSGVNSRLQATIIATIEAATKLRALGGDTIYHAGDAFHVRGRVAPSVLNPVMDLYKSLIKSGFRVHMIPGNHDLEKNESDRAGNAVTALESVGVIVAHGPRAFAPDRVALFPWYKNVNDLMMAMQVMAARIEDELDSDPANWDAVIHAPVDGVLPHLPEHGLKGHELSSLGFCRVFAGHYHNHKQVDPHVYSIGALTHQNWGDVGSRAGYCIVYPDRVEQFETSAPKFLDVENTDPSDFAGNFVRARLEFESPEEIEKLRAEILSHGALGAHIVPVRKTVVTRAAPTSAGATSMTIEDSMRAYLVKQGLNDEELRLGMEILNEARSAA